MSDVLPPAEYGGWRGGGGSTTGGTSTGGTAAGAAGAAGARVARRGAIGGGVAAHPMVMLRMPRPRHSRRRRATIGCLPSSDVILNDTQGLLHPCNEENLCHASQGVQHGRRG